MRANVPRSFETLTSSDKKKINQYYTDMLNSELDKTKSNCKRFGCSLLALYYTTHSVLGKIGAWFSLETGNECTEETPS